jgi:hypothetical protein
MSALEQRQCIARAVLQDAQPCQVLQGVCVRRSDVLEQPVYMALARVREASA